MACRGVHFSLNSEQSKRLLSAKSDAQRLDVIEEIEAQWDEEHLQQTDKAWDAIHRCLTDGTLRWGNGNYPLNRAILGGRRLYEGEHYIITFVSAVEVPDVAQAMAELNEPEFRERYFSKAKDYAPEFGEGDFEYTWAYFEGLRDFFGRAAKENRAVVFSVDQ